MEVSDEDTCAKFDGTNYIVGPNVCASVTKDGEACKWDSSNSKCLTVSTTTNPCTTPGLNKEACITKT